MSSKNTPETIEYNAGGKVATVKVFKKKRLAAELAKIQEDSKKQEKLGPLRLRSLFHLA